MAGLRAGLIGCGGRGRAHAQGYAQTDEVDLVACADVNPEATQGVMRRFGASTAYDDYRTMLAKEALDVVSVCLWPKLHLDAILACAEAGVKLINAEKPMAPTYGESVRMHAACEQAGILLTFSHQRRFLAEFIKARDLARDGAIGRLTRLEGYCSNLFDWGTHWFDMLFFYNDQTPVEWVMGQIDVAEEKSVFGAFLETNGLSFFRYENGASGMLVTGEDHGGGCANRLIGTEGTIEVHGGGAPVRIWRLGQTGWETPDLSDMPAKGGETVRYIQDSVAALREGYEPELSSRKALMATELIFATYESARRRARVWLPLAIDDSPLLSMLDSGDLTIPDYPARLSAAEAQANFELLFNGQNLSGWKPEGTANAWTVEQGFLTCTGRGEGVLRTEQTYGDFALRLDYRLSPAGRSAVRLWGDGRQTDARTSIAIPLADDRNAPLGTASTGALLDVAAPTLHAGRKAGTWNGMEIVSRQSTLQVSLNGKQVLDCDLSRTPVAVAPESAIALENAGARVQFRNVRVKRLA
ncbi:MAG: DUF1080 domain-containing protein [Kiritimatiellae bacterium]|nr:DUF1080 domain-containing protein [Kiritimatiellia bacterium]